MDGSTFDGPRDFWIHVCGHHINNIPCFHNNYGTRGPIGATMYNMGLNDHGYIYLAQYIEMIVVVRWDN